MKKYTNKYVKRALTLYSYVYDDSIDIYAENEKFYQNYLRRVKYFGTKKNQTPFKFFYVELLGFYNIDHVAAKRLMFQGHPELAGKYFSRTAFWGLMGKKNSIPAEYIDPYTDYLNYAFFVEDKDTIQLAIDMLINEWKKEDAQSKEYKTQWIYPKTYFLHFLIEKWLGENPILPRLFKEFSYKGGYGIYQAIIDHWNDLSVLPNTYWNELCDYHLNGLSLYGSEKWEKEEFLLEGIIPMELLNLIKVRKKLELDIPQITHELFSLPTSQFPVIPTGYNPDTDVLFQLIHQTAITKHPYTIEEIIDLLKEKYGEELNYFI